MMKCARLAGLQFILPTTCLIMKRRVMAKSTGKNLVFQTLHHFRFNSEDFFTFLWFCEEQKSQYLQRWPLLDISFLSHILTDGDPYLPYPYFKLITVCEFWGFLLPTCFLRSNQHKFHQRPTFSMIWEQFGDYVHFPAWCNTMWQGQSDKWLGGSTNQHFGFMETPQILMWLRTCDQFLKSQILSVRSNVAA